MFQKTWTPDEVIGQYMKVGGRLQKIVAAQRTMVEATDPSGKANRYFLVTFEDGESARFWERTW